MELLLKVFGFVLLKIVLNNLIVFKRVCSFYYSNSFNTVMVMVGKFKTILLIENSILQKEFLVLFLFLTFAIFLTVLIIGASYFIARQNPESEKLSAYECGFEPYEDTRHTFDIRFCVIAILFIVWALKKVTYRLLYKNYNV